jgi:hypothetical protein
MKPSRSNEDQTQSIQTHVVTIMGINVIRSELVRPSEDTPHGPFWLSNLDLGVRSGYSPTIYLFRPRHDDRSGFFSADVLRTALAMALVLFYPLAGRLGMAPDGRVEINCNGEGAVFVVAESDVVLDDLEDFMPSKAMSDMFVPPYEKEVGPGAPLLLLQVSLVRYIIPFLTYIVTDLLTIIFWQSGYLLTWRRRGTRHGHAPLCP